MPSSLSPPGSAVALAGVLAAALLLGGGEARACASCGSGTGDPLVLYANERAKVYLGLSQSLGRQVLTSTGEVGHALGARSQGALTLSAGLALGRRAFVTLTVPGLANGAPGALQAGLGDPSLAVRSTLLAAVAAAARRPQVQVVAGFRPGLARSTTAGTVRRRDLMDRFGEGSNELRAGLDLWWAHLPIKVGVATFLLAPLPRMLATGERSRAGATWRLVASGGLDLGGRGRWVVSVVRDRQGNRVTNGAQVGRSGRVALGVQSAVDLFVGRRGTLRLSVGRGALAWSRNATRDLSGGLAYMHAW